MEMRPMDYMVELLSQTHRLAIVMHQIYHFTQQACAGHHMRDFADYIQVFFDNEETKYNAAPTTVMRAGFLSRIQHTHTLSSHCHA